MAFEQNPYAIKITLVAGADFSASQYKFVTKPGAPVTGTPSCLIMTSATARPFGILQNAPKQNLEAEVTVSGITKVLVGTGGVTVGDAVGSNASGDCVALTPVASSATKYIVGTALQTGAAGDIIAVAISCSNAVLSA
jgi:hypothetical protein